LNHIYGRKCIVQFLVPSHVLLDYFDRDRELELIGQNILRLYGGIFEVPTRVSVEIVVQRAQRSDNAVLNAIKKMHKDGIIDIELFESDVQLHFLVPREDDRTLNRLGREVDILNNNIIQKIKQTIRFVTNDSVCKSKQLLAYFGEKKTEDCGICSVCLKKKNNTKNIKAPLETLILELIEEQGPLEAANIAQQLNLPLSVVIEKLRSM